MAGGGVQKIYMVFLREPSRRDRSGSDLFHLRDGFEIKMNFDRNVSCFIFVNSTFLLVHGTLHPFHANPLEVIVLLSLYLAVLDDQSNEEQFIDVYNTYKRLVYHTAYKIMGDSYLAEDVLQEVFLYVAKNFSKIHRENCHELAAYLVSCSRSRAYDMLRKQREEPLEEVPDAPDDAPVPDDAVVSTDNIQHLTELIGQIKPMYRDPLRLLAMGYTNREIAESLGLTDEVVRMRLFRGRKLLWKELNSHE